MVEDDDLWRWVQDSTVHMGVSPVIVADGRTPFEVFTDQRFLGNSRLAPCSSFLKQKPARAWLDAHANPDDTVLYVGIDWSEAHRTTAIVKGWAPWTVRFPMCHPPYLSEQDMLDAAIVRGLTPPRLYALGFSHNNFYWTTNVAAARLSTGSVPRSREVPLRPDPGHTGRTAAQRATGRDWAAVCRRRLPMRGAYAPTSTTSRSCGNAATASDCHCHCTNSAAAPPANPSTPRTAPIQNDDAATDDSS